MCMARAVKYISLSACAMQASVYENLMSDDKMSVQHINEVSGNLAVWGGCRSGRLAVHKAAEEVE